MSDDPQTAPAPAGTSAGSLLRAAREAMGLPIDELASMLKVAPGKIEWLEADRHNEFPDPVFVRALAQSMCRTLKIDAAPVLALLPKTPGQRLDKIHVGLNAQYREGPTPRITDDWSGIAKPLLWGPALLVGAAALVYFFPTDWANPPKVSPRVVTPAPAASGSAEPVAAGSSASTPAAIDAAPRPAGAQAPVAATAPASPVAPVAATPSAPAPAPAPVSPPVAPPAATVEAAAPTPAQAVTGVLQFRTSADSWIEVQDARGVMLLSRGLEAGEAVGLSGAMPLKVTIGNVRATQVTFRGKAMDLALFTRDNIARFELK
jgi:cytoskeleton protein RodZ